VLTTLHTQYEHEIKALLHIPATVETAALILVGYPAEGARGGRARRRLLSRGRLSRAVGREAATRGVGGLAMIGQQRRPMSSGSLGSDVPENFSHCCHASGPLYGQPARGAFV
jgi:hypothetical protein